MSMWFCVGREGGHQLIITTLGGNDELQFWAELLADASQACGFLQSPGISGRWLRMQE